MAANILCRFFSRRFSGGTAGIRGLTNYCLSCCVNTLLQTFSATWELVDLLERWDSAHVSPSDSNIAHEMKKFLVAYQCEQPISHTGILHCLDRNGVQLHTQHDADEVFFFILNLIQTQMDDKILVEQIQSLYKVSVQNHVQCLQCSSVQTKASFLLSLPLHVKEDDTSLKDCLTSFFEDHELRGLNCCFCPQCEVKTPSKQGVRLLTLPPILCVQLKRYRNNDGYTRKLGYRVTFPETFDFLTTADQAFSKDFAQTDCRYSLYAVVVHSGSAGCGHYTTYVRHRASGSWFYADDSHTCQVTWSQVQTSYGGGRRPTAYMLMYRRELGGNQQQHEAGTKCNKNDNQIGKQ